MEDSCSTLEPSVSSDDTHGRSIWKMPIKKTDGDGVDKGPIGVVQSDCDHMHDGGDGEKTKQQFVIPRRKDASSSELLQRVDLCTRDGKEIQSIVQESMRKSESQATFVIQEMHIVKNQSQLKQYHAKRHEMKEEGRTMAELGERYGFISTESFSKVKALCENGLSTESQTKQIVLGDPSYGVYLCKHADVVSPVPPQVGRNYYLVVFKYTKGRVKGVNAQCHGHVVMEPTPNFDCHALKCPLTDSSPSHNQLYDSCQLYLYEFGELDMAKQPRHCVPYAVVKFNIAEKGSSQSLSCPQESEIQSLQHSDVQSNHDGILAWQGPLYNKNKYIGCVGIYSYSHDKLALNFNETLNMKAKVTFEKLGSSLPKPIFLAGPPYKARQGAVVRGSNSYHYCQIRAQSDCNGNFEKLVRFLLDNSWAGVAEVSGITKLYILPTSTFTGTLGMTSSNDDLRLHGLLCWKTASSSLLASHDASTDAEETNLLVVDRRKAVAAISSGKDMKQSIGTSGQDGFVDSGERVSTCSHDNIPLGETVDPSCSKAACTDFDNIGDKLAVCKTPIPALVSTRESAPAPTSGPLNVTTQSMQIACADGLEELREPSRPVQKSAGSFEDLGQGDDLATKLPVGIIFSSDISNQSGKSSPTKCGAEIVKNDRDDEGTAVTEEERDAGVATAGKTTNTVPSDSRETVSLPQWTDASSARKENTYRRQKGGKIKSALGKTCHDNSGEDPGTAKVEETVCATSTRVEDSELGHRSKRGRPRGRPAKRKSKKSDYSDSKRVALANSRDRSSVHGDGSGTGTVSAEREEIDLASTCSVSTTEKITVTSSNSVSYPHKSAWRSHESSLANTGQYVSSTDENTTRRDGPPGRCEEHQPICLATVKIESPGHFADEPTQSDTHKACIPDPLIASTKGTRTRVKPRDPRQHRSSHGRKKLVEVEQDTTNNTPKDSLVASLCRQTSEPDGRRDRDSQRVNVDTDSQRAEIGQSDATSNRWSRPIKGDSTLPGRSRPKEDKGSKQRSIKNWPGDETFAAEQKRLAETRMQLWLERRKDDAELSSGCERQISMHRDVQSPENGVESPEVARSFRRRSIFLQSFDREQIQVENDEITQEESERHFSSVVATVNPSSSVQDLASDCAMTPVDVNKADDKSLCLDKEEVGGSGCKNAKTDNWKRKEYRSWKSNGCTSPVSSNSRDAEKCNTEMSCVIADENGRSDAVDCREVEGRPPILSDISADSPRRSVSGKRQDSPSRDTRDIAIQTDDTSNGRRDVATQTEPGNDSTDLSMLLRDRPHSLELGSNVPLIITRKQVADAIATSRSTLTSVVEKFEHAVRSRSRSKEHLDKYLSSIRKEADSSGMPDLHDADGTVEDISPAVSPTEVSAFGGTGIVPFSSVTDSFESFHQLRSSQLTGRSQQPVLRRRKRKKRWDVTVSDLEMERNYISDYARDHDLSQQRGRVETMKQEIISSVWEKLIAEKRRDPSSADLRLLGYRGSGTFLAPDRVYSPSRPTYEDDSTPPLEDYDED